MGPCEDLPLVIYRGSIPLPERCFFLAVEGEKEEVMKREGKDRPEVIYDIRGKLCKGDSGVERKALARRSVTVRWTAISVCGFRTTN